MFANCRREPPPETFFFDNFANFVSDFQNVRINTSLTSIYRIHTLLASIYRIAGKRQCRTRSTKATFNTRYILGPCETPAVCFTCSVEMKRPTRKVTYSPHSYSSLHPIHPPAKTIRTHTQQGDRQHQHPSKQQRCKRKREKAETT